MRRQRLFLILAAVASATLWAYACGDGTTEPPPYFPEPTTVTVSPGTAELNALGATVQLSAEVRDQNGAVMARATVTWASSNAAVATVGVAGLVTAVANGTATITATAGDASGSATVTVAQEVSAVKVAPDTATVVEADTLRLAATATDANGQVVTGAEFAWASGDTAVAVVDASGLLTGVGAGQTQVTATAAGVTGRAQLTVVAPVPTAVAVTADTVVLTAVGQTAQLTAEVRDQLGRVMDGVPVAWSSGDTAVAVVDSAGLVTAVGNGATTVTARAGEASGDVPVTVMQSTGSVTVSPPADTITPGDTLRLVAEAYDESGHVVAGASFAWSSSNTAVATVDPSGLVRGVVVGTTTITAAAGDASGTSEITVTNPDQAALVALYNATDGPNWVDNTNWLTDAPLGEWYGVDTNGAGRVVGINLAGRRDNAAQRSTSHGLRGELPPELGDLSNLEYLNLARNDLSGAIPPELGDLANLRTLFLSVNALSGAIPPELGGLANLQWLALSVNDLSGAIPPELGNLANLRRLSLWTNALSGAIPPELGNLANLWELGLNRNALSGAIPPELGDLSDLGRLFLSENALSGAIPPELGNLAKLEGLGLSGNELSGAIPPELGDLSNLRFLYLGGNALSGAIPRELGDLANLTALWLSENALSGAIPPGLGDLASLEELSLWGNALSGAIPPELGDLANLRRLWLSGNDLSGTIPQSFLQLDQLQTFFVGGQDVCVPGVSAFVAWFEGIERHAPKTEVFCNAADLAALESLYDLTDGADWTRSERWLGDDPVEEWYGVTADSLGHVTELDLDGNGLNGHLAAALGNLPRMTVLRISDNALDDRLPLALTALDLDTFHYDGTDLCEPTDADFRRWLEGIASRRGTEVQCGPLTERDVLTALYESTGGPGWTKNDGWLSEAPLGRWQGVRVDAQGRVVGLSLWQNDLTGAIPAELGGLPNLRHLYLEQNDLSGAIPPELGGLSNLQTLHLGGIEDENDLSGAIPPELGGLSNLSWLHLGGNDLSGAIPPELGGLSNLGSLYLHGNDLSGAIPPELGGLSNLEHLFLYGNDLSGAIPPELGDLANLERLSLAANDLSGAVPPTFDGLASLSELELSRNAGLAGAMPAGLRNLALESLLAGGTELCVPREPAFVEWLATIPRQWIAVCGEPPVAYLVQAVQSRAHPVPLVAGEDALLRVFVTAAMETTEGIPEVRARFYLNGTERHVADIPGSSTPIPTEINEGALARSPNAEIPGRIVRPGLEMVVEIDPDGELDASLGVARRIPQEGRLAVEVREMPVLDLTVIPFLWSSDPDSAIIGLADGMAADPEGHALLEETHVLLPVGDIDVTAHAPVASTSNNTLDLLAQTYAIRVLEGGGGHYMGMMSGSVTGAGGLAQQPGRSSFSQPHSGVVAHELGHNMSLSHAPCGGASNPDPSFPYTRGAIGAWGYDFGRGRLVPATRKDHMTYCDPTWTSDYHFTNALVHRLDDEGASAAALAAGPVRSLLLWGGVDTTATPFLNPAFVADAPPALPDSAGDYTVTGRDASGRDLFSLSFTMSVVLSEEAEASSFVFALPVQPGWAAALASVNLSGPAGTTTLDGESDMPMAILRDPVTGQVRGFLRDIPLATEAAADAVGARAPGLEVLFSRGIPGTAAWRR